MQQKVFDKTFITFLIVGVVNTLFGTAIMFVLYNVFDCSYWVSSFCDYFFGSILSYFLNKHFTFHYQGNDWKSIVKFALIYCQPPTLCPVSHTTLGAFCITCQRPISPVFIGQKFFAFKKH